MRAQQKYFEQAARRIEGRIQSVDLIFDFRICPIPGTWRISLESLTVMPKAREMGVGTMIMRGLTQWADMMGAEIVLCVPNTRAKNFYKRFGFQESKEKEWDLIRMPGAKNCVMQS